MTDDYLVNAWKRLKKDDYRTSLNFLRDQFYVGNWVSIHHTSAGGAGDGSSLTVPVNQSFVYVGASISPTAGNTQFTLDVNGIILETINDSERRTSLFHIPVFIVPSGQVIKIQAIQAVSAWTTLLYGYLENETQQQFNNTII